jgi:two-component system, sensor histidine kinase PdtaS
MLKALTAIFLFACFASNAQSISPEEAKGLTNMLTDSQRDTAQIRTLLKLAKYHIFKPGENKSDLDSAVSLVRQAENLNVGIKSKWANGYILLVKSYLTRENKQIESAKETARQAADILKTEADKLLAGEAYFDYSGYFSIYETTSLKDRIKLVDTAVLFFQQSGDQERVGASLHMLGDLYQIDGLEFIALQKLRLALDAYAFIHHDAVQGIYSLIAKIHARQRDYKKGLDNGLLALKTAEKAGDSSIQMCMINSDIGQIYALLGENEKAMSYFKKGLEIAQKHKDNGAIYITTTYIAFVWNSLNKPQAAIKTLNELIKQYGKPVTWSDRFNTARTYINGYTALKEYSKAEPYVRQLLDMIETKEVNYYFNLSCYSEVVKFYVNSGQYQLATKYLHKHTALAEQIPDLLQMGNSHKLWFMLDTARLDYRSAISHLVRYKDLSDSLFNETKSHQISELEIQYETEKKENDIVIKDQNIQLLTKQDQLQKTKLQQGAILRNISFAVLALLAIIMALLYNRYRLKQRTNKKLEMQQSEIAKQNHSLQHLLNEKEWLLKEIHHRVKNNLQIVMSLLNSQSVYIDNDAALTAIHDSQHRVHAMSLIHQKLYNSENLSSIDMSFYVRELVSYLRDSFDTGQRIRFELNVEPLELDVSQAVPLGLILNEAITNSLKYAFPGDMEGVITISLSNSGHDNYLLTISDSGIGMPVHLKDKKPGSLGMSLMAGLSEDLEGNFSIENNNGTKIKISFVHDMSVKRPEPLVSSFVTNN